MSNLRTNRIFATEDEVYEYISSRFDNLSNVDLTMDNIFTTSNTYSQDSPYTPKAMKAHKTSFESGKGRYKGKTRALFKIVPRGTSVKKVLKTKKAITVKWKKQSAKMAGTRITGYQIQIATFKK